MNHQINIKNVAIKLSLRMGSVAQIGMPLMMKQAKMLKQLKK